MYATLDHAHPIAPGQAAARPERRLRFAGDPQAEPLALGAVQPRGSGAAPERSRYGEARRPNVIALLGAAGIVGGTLAAMLALNVAQARKQAAPRLVVAQLEAPRPPAPPPPPKSAPQPLKPVVQPVSPVVVPPPPVVLTSAPATISTSPSPAPAPAPVPVFAPEPPAPSAPAVAVAAPPRMENAGDLSSKMIAADPPRYPVESRRKHEQGTVVLLVILGTDGKVADISISRSSGFDRLDKAALSAVRHWKWSPTRRDGAPVMVRGLVEIPFVLQT
ncbi:energy transducer TonB [Novosphingobium lindaniclasticum]|uniref:TonB C-terminal domain-containing protein n=1 Tax=Novosphingobium lindaniclasticum LE124 TaxID=1096930 RepID=T0HT06_9SPHN|nr:energy transducer TonB [Novosphingobium lindaniclasticum]EQB19501.1 hypothetical protein L284_01445 [Novosphingobium lindaniclasticum LE124]